MCDVSTGVCNTQCAGNDVVVETACAGGSTEGGTLCAESILLRVPRKTVYTLTVVNNAPGKNIYDTGAQVDVYLGWGWWGSAWSYTTIPVPGGDPSGADPTRTNNYWAVFCSRRYSWSGFVLLNRFGKTLDVGYSAVTNGKCPKR
jgi:hypothetical protein